MHLEFFVEEESAERLLQGLLPKVLGKSDSFSAHVFQGKPDLLDKLPARLKGYQTWIPSDWRIVVLVDEDRQDCRKLKDKLERAALGAGFSTKSPPGRGGQFTVLNRIVVEEIEAWYFGDVQALAKAYPGVPTTLDRKEKFRNPDTIAGGARRNSGV